jgi:hypothetical protein
VPPPAPAFELKVHPHMLRHPCGYSLKSFGKGTESAFAIRAMTRNRNHMCDFHVSHSFGHGGELWSHPLQGLIWIAAICSGMSKFAASSRASP